MGNGHWTRANFLRVGDLPFMALNSLLTHLNREKYFVNGMNVVIKGTDECREGLNIPNSIILTPDRFQPEILEPFSAQIKSFMFVMSSLEDEAAQIFETLGEIDLAARYLVIVKDKQITQIQQFLRRPLSVIRISLTVANIRDNLFTEFYTNMFYQNNREISVEKIGTFLQGKMVYTGYPSIHPQKMKDFQGYEFTVSAFHYPPKVAQYSANEWGGVEIRLLKEVGNSLNFGLKVEPPADNAKWGTVLIQNGTKIATGLTGDMFYGRKNFGGANLFITLDRLEIMDMTIPYHIDRACFMVPKAKEIPHYAAIIAPYPWLVWLIILCTFILVITPGMYIFHVDEEGFEPQSRIQRLHGAFWEMFGVFTAGFWTTKNKFYFKKTSARMFVTCVFFYSMIITWGYRESIKAVLTVQSFYTELDTIRDLVDSDLKWGVRDRGGWPDWFKDSNDELSQRVYDGFTYVQTFDQGVSKVAEGDYAFMNSEAALRYVIAAKYTNQFRESSLHIATQCYVPFRIGVAMPKRSAYKESVDKKIRMLFEGGFTDYWLANENERAEKENRKKFDESNTDMTKPKIKKLSLYDLQGAFFIYGLGVSFALLALFGENLDRVFGSNNSNKIKTMPLKDT